MKPFLNAFGKRKPFITHTKRAILGISEELQCLDEAGKRRKMLYLRCSFIVLCSEGSSTGAGEAKHN